MEFGADTTLYNPDTENLTGKAVQKELEKPYYKKGNPWNPNLVDLMSDVELSDLEKDRRREMKSLLLRMMRIVPKIDNFSSQEMKQMTESVAVARESAISIDGVSIVSLRGQETILSEYLGEEVSRPVWEFEPRPGFESKVGKLDSGNPIFNEKDTLERVSRADEDKLWNFLDLTIEDIKREKNISLDIKNLTPNQAVYLVRSLINNRMNYEKLITGEEVLKIVDKVRNNDSKTSRLDIVDLAENEPKKAKKEINRLKNKIDRMSADKLLEYQFGVCRHIAATAQKLFEVLKKRQEGLLLNGSYLAYHDENIGQQIDKGLEENHAYNVLAVTVPEDDGKTEISLSVLDPTWMLGGDRIDYTYKRVSQAVSFLSMFGADLGVENNSEVCENLAKKAAQRLESFMISNSTIELFDDYASLLVQSGSEVRGRVVEKLEEVFFSSTNFKRIEFVSRLFDVPVLSYANKDGNRMLRWEHRLAVVNEISHIKFDRPLYREESIRILENLKSNIESYSSVALNLMNINLLEIIKHKLNDFNTGKFLLVNECIRASVELGVVPEKKYLTKINKMINIDKRFKNGLINSEMVEKMRKMISENETF